MTEPEPPAAWRRSSACVGQSHCVEVGSAAGEVLMRDSKSPSRDPLRFLVDAWEAFVRGVRDGEFDA